MDWKRRFWQKQIIPVRDARGRIFTATEYVPPLRRVADWLKRETVQTPGATLALLVAIFAILLAIWLAH